MSFPSPTALKEAGFFHSTALFDVIRRLKDLSDEMAGDGFGDEATTLKTTISDLQWQYEGLIDKELVGQWPNGPRRALRSVRRSA